MHNAVTVSYVTTDSGRVVEVVRVTPVFVRLGAPRRGLHAASRLARSRRSNARNAALRSYSFEAAVVPNVKRF